MLYLEVRRKFVGVLYQVAECHAGAVVRALGLQGVTLHLSEKKNRVIGFRNGTGYPRSELKFGQIKKLSVYIIPIKW